MDHLQTQEYVGAMTSEEYYAYLRNEMREPQRPKQIKMNWSKRINATFLKTTETDQILRNRLKRYKDDAINWYAIDYSKPVNNEEGS
jgi:hypothetical protein